ncbi:MAG: Lrp/AsnC family transcriptional regulator [Deltaproteobacteria bacterium]|nr:Lrp/AsnC family transcriptional regulator [Deltaproteobacteria bacterium]MBW2053172.1 Lrp/AsnC family transcriptional regulator [Deltaproteobacteria bacterium]MBW2141126.1 Lrp/AsnC family transcriptional regulator [Deltaproteobacteria bacterium]MBW2324198.1 Lrp/AsnC family transcriptional regulator [Deltaproteobacteria bacterium]
MSPEEKRLIYELSGDLGASARPFKELGQKLGLPEEQILETIRSLINKGYLRRFGATLRHQLSGFTANAMVAWKVEEARVDEAGQALASFKEVTHCYHRPGVPGWPYNLYTMIHGSSEEDCRALAESMSRAADITEYELLFSHEEHKKTSMRYFE